MQSLRFRIPVHPRASLSKEINQRFNLSFCGQALVLWLELRRQPGNCNPFKMIIYRVSMSNVKRHVERLLFMRFGNSNIVFPHTGVTYHFLHLLLSFFSLLTFLLTLNFCYRAVKSKQMRRQHSECLFLVSAVQFFTTQCRFLLV